MGVKLLLRPVPAMGVAPGAAHMATLQALIDDLCCSKSEGCFVACQLMKRGMDETCWLVTQSEARETVFLLSQSEHEVMEVQPQMVKLIERKLEYQAQTTIRFEGKSFSKGDFNIRLFTVHQLATNQQVFIGHLLELEYLPAQHASTAELMLGDFSELLAQQLAALSTASGAANAAITGLEPMRPSYDMYELLPGMAFSRRHAAVSYADAAVRILSANGRATQQGAGQH